MSTRLQRPSIWRQIAVSACLVAFQGYLIYNAIGGQFGIESQKQMHIDIGELQAQSGSLQAEIDSYRHRVELFDPAKLDPDILTERARALLSMAQADDVIVMVDQSTGLPLSGLTQPLSETELSDKIDVGID